MIINNVNNKYFEENINLKKNINNKSIGYITNILACSFIPYSKIKDNFFKKSNGITSLKIISDPEYGLPYGLVPRMVMIWLCTEVKFKKSNIIYLGKTQNEFIKKLGITPTGGVNGSISRIKKQVIRLFHSTISLTSIKENEHKFINLNIVDNGIFFWNKKYNNKIHWNNKIILSKRFFDKIRSTSLSINLRVIKILRSPLAIDIYIWLIWRFKLINNKKKSILISWVKLKLQFGSNYNDSSKGLYNFKKEFLKQLKIIYFFYSNINIRISNIGLKINYNFLYIP